MSTRATRFFAVTAGMLSVMMTGKPNSCSAVTHAVMYLPDRIMRLKADQVGTVAATGFNVDVEAVGVAINEL